MPPADTPESRPDDAPGADLRAAPLPESMPADPLTEADDPLTEADGPAPDAAADLEPDPVSSDPSLEPSDGADSEPAPPDPGDAADDQPDDAPADQPNSDDAAQPAPEDGSHAGAAGVPTKEPQPPLTPVAAPDENAAARDRPAPRRPAGPPVRPSSVLVAAAATSGWAAVVSFAPVLVVVLLAWFGASAVSGGSAVRFALVGWLLGHGVPFTAAHGPVGLAPLGLTALIVWRLVRAGAHTARAVGATPREAPHVVGAVMLSYGVIGGAAALFASTARFEVSSLRALLTTGVLAGLAAAPGALVETGAGAALWRRFPEPVRQGLRGGAIAALVVSAAGAALAGLATVLAYRDAVDLYDSYRTGFAGGLGITLVCLLYAPNLAIWGGAYLVGPGFGFGVGTEVTVFTVSLGPLPAVPVLAGLPTGPAPTAVAVLLTVPVLAGMAAGLSLARRHLAWDWGPLLGGAALVGPAAGVPLGLASFAAAGSLGAGQLAAVGPFWWQVGLVATGLVGMGSLLAAAATKLLEGERQSS